MSTGKALDKIARDAKKIRKVLTQWKCDCGEINGIENRRCRKCLTPMPRGVK